MLFQNTTDNGYTHTHINIELVNVRDEERRENLSRDKLHNRPVRQPNYTSKMIISGSTWQQTKR